VNVLSRVRGWLLCKFGYDRADQQRKTAHTSAALSMTDSADVEQKRVLVEDAADLIKWRHSMRQAVSEYPIESALFPKGRP
jgi:hypothetical protein